jgi:hypothetical protein
MSWQLINHTRSTLFEDISCAFILTLSSQVRCSVAYQCTEICLALGYQRVDVLVDLFLGLVHDSNQKVKRVAVSSLAGLASSVIALAELEAAELVKQNPEDPLTELSTALAKGRARIVQSIVPAIFNDRLVNEPSVDTRLALVDSIASMLPLLAPAPECVETLVPLLAQILEDESLQVCCVVCSELGPH